MIDVVEKNSEGKLYHRALIGERIQSFTLKAYGLKAADVKEVLAWLASDEFAETIRIAELDGDRVKRRFHDIITEGNNRNVEFS